MADRLGLLDIPVAKPVLNTNPLGAPVVATPAAGDPLLAVVASFAATVLQADCGTAWTAYEAGVQDLPTTVPGAPGASPAAGSTVVRIVDFVDPRKGRVFDANDFPGLFVFRRGAQGTYERLCSDTGRRMVPVALHWIAMMEPREVRGEHDTFANAIGAVLTRAFHAGRHPSWVVPSDLAQPQALLAGLATATTQVTLTGPDFTGPLGAKLQMPARPIRITAAAATGAYDTTQPIVITGPLEQNRAGGGKLFTERVYLPSADGGGHVETVFRFSDPRLTSIVLPPMLSTAGSIDIGYGDSPEASRGSMVQRHARARIRVLRPGELLPLSVQVPEGAPRKGYEAVEVVLQVFEHLRVDPLLAFDPNDGTDMTILRNGEPLPTVPL